MKHEAPPYFALPGSLLLDVARRARLTRIIIIIIIIIIITITTLNTQLRTMEGVSACYGLPASHQVRSQQILHISGNMGGKEILP